MKFHDAANIFPLLEDDELDRLVDDIRKNGLLEKIETLDGQILDGRNRYRACLLAQVEPQTREVRVEDPVTYVLSRNLHRRHLTPSQVSMVGARARDLYDKQAKERQKEGQHRGREKQSGRKVENLPPTDKAKARDQVGKAVGVSGRTIDFATKVLSDGTPELVQAVDEGRMAVSTAAVLASEPAAKQKEVLASGRHNRRYKSTKNGAGEPPEDTPEPPEGQRRGVGILRANEAIDCLKRIPKKDGLRKRGFQLVTDWIKKNQ